jgi:exopolysaccharide biosynthesis protein
MTLSSILKPKVRVPQSIVEHFVIDLPDGTPINVHIARYLKSRVKPRLVVFDKQTPLLSWCREHHVSNAINGGFTMHHEEQALGEIWAAGKRHKSVRFTNPWHNERGSVHITTSGHIKIAPRHYLPSRPEGDLLQAAPLLVHKGRSLIIPGKDPEGISASSDQFDDDWTDNQRYPRSAIGSNEDIIFCVVVEGYGKGRKQGENTGLTLSELADLMIEVGATEALNLDGGSSASLVANGKLVNKAQGHITVNYEVYPEGRPISNAIIFQPLEKFPLI